MSRLRVMTYNVRACLGLDGARRPERVAEVIRRAEPDLVALQELDVGVARSGGVDQPARIAELAGMRAHFTAARSLGEGSYGNAVLAARPFAVHSEGALPVRFGEPRAAQRVTVAVGGAEVELVNTHLSIHLVERWMQARALFAEVERVEGDPRFPSLSGVGERLILCGDLNSGPWSPVYRWLSRRLTDAQRAVGGRAAATWPANRPLLRLDYVWFGASVGVERVSAPRDELTSVTSDHLPLVVDLTVDGAA
jgi:endonuclease/exonuclease/phosphatase family metal-dependent hydrolase